MADTPPWLVVGLGNPGPKYAGNRHNIGFMAVESWIESELPLPPAWSSRFSGLVANATGRYGRCVVLKPQTFMNKSGASVAEAARFFRIPPENIVVVHDELDFEFGRIAVKKGGGHGGHNGIRDIIASTGATDFLRIRAGIGRPARGDVSSWVLSDFSIAETTQLAQHLERIRAALSCILLEGYGPAMNQYNVAPPGVAP